MDWFRVGWTLAVLGAVGLLSGCSDDKNLRDELAAQVELYLQGRAEEPPFEIRLPDYLPPGTRRTPGISPYEDGLMLTFPALDAAETSTPWPDIVIHERVAPLVTPEPWPSLVPQPSIDSAVVDDRYHVVISREEFTEVGLVQLISDVNGVRISVQAVWPQEDGPDRQMMESETFKVLESMLK